MADGWDAGQQANATTDIMNGDDEEMEGQEEEEEDDILDMGEDTGVQQALLLMRFCPNDSAMLYPREDKRNKKLMYGCRLCNHLEDASDQPLVYRNEKKKEVGNILHTVPSAVSDDPTLARSQNEDCANCHHNEAVFFQSDIAQSDSLALIFVCCNCDHKWVK